MKLDKKTGFLILGAIAVLALIIIFYGYFASLSPSLPSGGGPSGSSTGLTPTYAPQGQLVSGFPPALILDDAARVTNSYAISSSNANQYTAVWNSSSSVASLYAGYKNYFTANGWTVTNDSVAQLGQHSLGAQNGSATVNILITTAGAGTQVIIGYLKR